jgi:hypothetical protein
MPVVLTGHFHCSGLAIIRTLRHFIHQNSSPIQQHKETNSAKNSNSAPTEHPLGAEETVELTGADSFPARPSSSAFDPLSNGFIYPRWPSHDAVTHAL